MERAKRAVKALVPSRHRDAVRTTAYRALHYGTQRYCPCCDSHLRRFHPFGEIPRPEAQCPVCGALERHRTIWLFFRRHPELLASARSVLHVAPEPQLARLLRRSDHIDYLSIDLDSDHAMVMMDVRNLLFADGSFDAMVCSHVLEHVPEDRQAMAEFFRVLRDGGWALLQVPVKGERTIEDPALEDPEERRRRFGQPDHVRVYGWDFADRLAAAGFSVSIETPAKGLDEATLRRMSLDAEEMIFFCRKPERPQAGDDRSTVLPLSRRRAAGHGRSRNAAARSRTVFARSGAPARFLGRLASK